MIYQRGKIWWIEYDENGKRIRSSLGTTDRVEAQLRADVRLAERDARKARTKLVLAIGGDAFTWAADRWHRMNHREKQAAVFSVFKGRCVYCSCETRIPLARDQRSPDRAVLDHRIPVSGGGSNAFDNIVLSCNACNAKKYDGDKP